MMRWWATCVVIAALALLSTARDVSALDYHDRPSWMFGVGWGIGRGNFAEGPDPPEEFSGNANDWRNGAVPSMRLGRMFGGRYMAGINWADWLVEYGADPVKYRRTLQSLALSLAVYPGDVKGPSGGLYLRAGGGLGWAGSGQKEATEGEKQHRGERIDEWGYSVFGEVGYEFWITQRVTAGANLALHYFGIGDDIVDEAAFSSTGIVLQVHF